jgi:TetR/AcrR family transcriptional regulator
MPRSRSPLPDTAPAQSDGWSDAEMAAMATLPGTGPEQRLREQRQRIDERIRKAAIVEFSQHGLRGASTQDIAARAGLTKPQLHYYIKGKERLYEELLASVVHRWVQDTSFDHASDDPAAVLASYVEDKIRTSLDDPELARIFGLEILSGAPHLGPHWPTAFEVTGRLAATLQRWMDEGRMRRCNPHLLLMNIWAMTSHYAYYAVQVRQMSARFPESPMDRDTVVREVTDLVLAGCGLAPHDGA